MDTLRKARKLRGEKLTEEQYKGLLQYRKNFNTDVAAAISIGIDRNVLTRVVLTKTGSKETISLILKALEN